MKVRRFNKFMYFCVIYYCLRVRKCEDCCCKWIIKPGAIIIVQIGYLLLFESAQVCGVLLQMDYEAWSCYYCTNSAQV